LLLPSDQPQNGRNGTRDQDCERRGGCPWRHHYGRKQRRSGDGISYHIVRGWSSRSLPEHGSTSRRGGPHSLVSPTPHASHFSLLTAHWSLPLGPRQLPSPPSEPLLC